PGEVRGPAHRVGADAVQRVRGRPPRGDRAVRRRGRGGDRGRAPLEVLSHFAGRITGTFGPDSSVDGNGPDRPGELAEEVPSALLVSGEQPIRLPLHVLRRSVPH